MLRAARNSVVILAGALALAWGAYQAGWRAGYTAGVMASRATMDRVMNQANDTENDAILMRSIAQIALARCVPDGPPGTRKFDAR